MENTCAPNRYDKKNNTCFSLDQLLELSSAFNRYYFKNSVGVDQKTNMGSTSPINIKPDKKYLLMELRDRFKTVCNGNDSCMLEQSFMKEIVGEMRDDLVNNTFRSKGPNNGSTEWLSTLDIDNVMKQYQNVYSNFHFVGAIPADCHILKFCSLNKINYNQLISKGIRYIGIIFNLDTHEKPGSHWVATLIDINNGYIYYCDSTGHPPTSHIKSFIDIFIYEYEKITNKKAQLKYNTKKYQTDNSECGIYSCNFIIRMLAGETFDHIVNNYLTFADINSCRDTYFLNNNKSVKVHAYCDPAKSTWTLTK